MAYRFRSDVSKEELDSFYLNSSQNGIMQSPSWAIVKDNWDHYFTCVEEEGKIVGSALVLVRRLPLGFSIAYIPRGPIMDYSNHDLVKFYFNELKAFAKKLKAITLRFDPYLEHRFYPFDQKDEPQETRNDDTIEFLKSIGAKHKGFTSSVSETTQPRFNAVMMMDKDYEDRIMRKTKQSLRTALRKGVELREGHQYLSEFAKAIHYTEQKQNIVLRDEEYFKNFLTAFKENALIIIAYLNFPKQIERLESELPSLQEELEKATSKQARHTAKVNLENVEKDLASLKELYEKEGKDEVILGGQLAVIHGNYMELLYQGNNTDYLSFRASYSLYKWCLDYCVEHNITKCSFGGIDGSLNDHLSSFKSNWPIHIEELIGEFNIILNPLMYSLFEKVYPIFRSIVSRSRD